MYFRQNPKQRRLQEIVRKEQQKEKYTRCCEEKRKLQSQCLKGKENDWILKPKEKIFLKIREEKVERDAEENETPSALVNVVAAEAERNTD
jgi:hypothetical protein